MPSLTDSTPVEVTLHDLDDKVVGKVVLAGVLAKQNAVLWRGRRFVGEGSDYYEVPKDSA